MGMSVSANWSVCRSDRELPHRHPPRGRLVARSIVVEDRADAALLGEQRIAALAIEIDVEDL
jgi:hypothetical protein